MIKRFRVLYQKLEVAQKMFGSAFDEHDIYEDELSETHAEVATIYGKDLNQVFFKMNDPFGEGLNPLTTPEGQEVVKATEVYHTSMSVNDVVQDMETGLYYVCKRIGWGDVL